MTVTELKDIEVLREEVRKVDRLVTEGINGILRGDPKPLCELWSRGEDVTFYGPDGGRLNGWEAVRAALEGMALQKFGGRVTRTEQRFIVTPELAYVLALQRCEGIKFGEKLLTHDVRTITIYRLERSEWKVIHYQVDVVPEMKEFVKP